MIKFSVKFTNEFGHKFKVSTKTETYPSMGEDELRVIGDVLSDFLRQIGYSQRGDTILMDSLTENELEAVQDFLFEYRKERDEDIEMEKE